MFGHDNDGNTTQNDNQSAAMDEPVEDGTLSKPDSDSDDSTESSAADVAAEDNLPLPPVEPPDQTASEPNLADPFRPINDDNNDLLSIKQNALQQLKPLVSHLDQTPQERFQTTMMMIQAADDQSLVSQAFEAAKGIADDKARAQALLDVINEINYFSAKKDS